MVLLLVLTGIVYAAGTVLHDSHSKRTDSGASGYIVPKLNASNQTTPVQIDEYGICKVVENLTYSDIYVPTDTQELHLMLLSSLRAMVAVVPNHCVLSVLWLVVRVVANRRV